MRRRIFIAVLILFATSYESVWAADPSPQPTTSPTNSGKTSLKPVNAKKLAQFVKARAAVSANIAAFNALVSKGKSGASAQKLKGLTNEINRQADTILKYAQSTNNSAAPKLASQLILDDDVAGHQSTHQAAAQRLMAIDARLALLEPVVRP